MRETWFELFHRRRSRAPEHFPGRTVVETFTATEQMLEEVLSVVPFCRKHEDVWSHRLATVLLEAGSQIDSLWRFEAEEENRPKRTGRGGRPVEWDIRDFFSFFAQDLAPKWVVFFGGERPLETAPFKAWQGVSGYSQADYQSLDWWQAYTKLKHDRFANQTLATLSASVAALAGLFLAIARCGYCDEYMMQANWVTCYAFHHADDDKIDSFPAQNQAAIESRLFSYPLGLWRGIANPYPWMNRNASERLRLWFGDYCARQCAAILKDAQRSP